MKKILAFGGSSSSSSINKQLAVYAANLVPDSTIEAIDFSEYVTPVYSTD